MPISPAELRKFFEKLQKTPREDLEKEKIEKMQDPSPAIAKLASLAEELAVISENDIPKEDFLKALPLLDEPADLSIKLSLLIDAYFTAMIAHPQDLADFASAENLEKFQESLMSAIRDDSAIHHSRGLEIIERIKKIINAELAPLLAHSNSLKRDQLIDLQVALKNSSFTPEERLSSFSSAFDHYLNHNMPPEKTFTFLKGTKSALKNQRFVTEINDALNLASQHDLIKKDDEGPIYSP